MAEISNDTEFRQQLEGLDTKRQRVVAARFIKGVEDTSGQESGRQYRILADYLTS